MHPPRINDVFVWKLAFMLLQVKECLKYIIPPPPYILLLLPLEGHLFLRTFEALHCHCGGGGGPCRCHLAL